jgi:hypothetical protein
LNQGRYIRRAIDSVLGQRYPHIEYLVVDGGSTDGTLDILRDYGDRVRWVSEPDRGQTHAINKGFRRARGEIVAWLNSDDAYLEDAVEVGAAALRDSSSIGLVYGRGRVLDEQDRTVGPFPGTEPFSLYRLLYCLDFILQPTTFFRRAALERVGFLDESLEFAMDWDLWIRLAAEADVLFVDRELAYTREYEATKTSRGGWRRIRELAGLARSHTGRAWTPGVRMYAFDTLSRSISRRLPVLLSRPLLRAVAGIWATTRSGVPVGPDGRLSPGARIVVPRRWGAADVELQVEPTSAAPAAVDLAVGAETADTIETDKAGRFISRVELPTTLQNPFVEIAVRSRKGRAALICLRVEAAGPSGPS